MVGVLKKFTDGPDNARSDYKFILVVIGLHLIVALLYKDVLGLNIEANPGWRQWDWFWQTLPQELLVDDLAESIWHLHSQPPLYNLYGAFFFNFFPADPMPVMHYANIVLGALLSGMIYVIVRVNVRNRNFALLVAALLALNPALFLYEAYLLYTLLTAFLVVLSVYLLACHSRTMRLAYIYCFILAMNLLVLTRSLYHVGVLAGAILFGAVLAKTDWKKVVVVGFAITMLAGGWYLKNYQLFGFFGSSSWDGMGLWKIASASYTLEELRELAEDEVVSDMVADVDVFRSPSAYLTYGFDETSSVEALSRDDFNNINVVKISDVYQQSAVKLILHDPIRYLESVFGSYIQFSRPSSRFKHLPLNAERIAVHETVVSQILEGQALARRFPFDFGSFIFFLLPASLALYYMEPIRRCGYSIRRWVEYVRTDSVMFLITILTVYTTVVACIAEAGENDRFKFLIEQLLWVTVVVVSYRYVRRLKVFQRFKWWARRRRAFV